MKNKLILFGLLVFCAGFSGCIPMELVWLPDSSGFLFTRDDRLVQFDLAKKSERVIISADWLRQGGCRPAIHPDGKQFALVRCKRSSTSDESQIHISAQVLIYDLAGNQSHASKELQWTEDTAQKGKMDDESGGVAAWSPDGKRILFAFGNTLAAYDCQQQTFKRFPGIAPPSVFVVFGLSPFLPDGTGFLSCREPTKKPNESASKKEPPRFVFVEWDGWEHDLKLSPELLQAWSEPEWRLVVLSARWEDGKAMLLSSVGMLCFDPRGRTATLKADETSRSLQECARKHDGFVMAHLGEIVLQAEQSKEGF